MLKEISLKQFVKEQMTLYNIEDNKNNEKKIYKKCQRELEKLKYWQNAKNKIIKKNKTKLFNSNQLNELSYLIGDYLLKLSNFNKEEFNKIKIENEKIIDNYYQDINNEKNENYEYDDFPKSILKDSDIIKLMIQTLFEEKYTINTQLWQEDLTFCRDNFLDSLVDELNFINSNEYIIRNRRLNNPSSYIIKKK